MRPENKHGLPDQKVAVDMVAVVPEPAVFAGRRVVAEHEKLPRPEREVEPILLEKFTGPRPQHRREVVDIAQHPHALYSHARPLSRDPRRSQITRRGVTGRHRRGLRLGPRGLSHRLLPGGLCIEGDTAAVDEQSEFVIDIGEEDRPGSRGLHGGLGPWLPGGFAATDRERRLTRCQIDRAAVGCSGFHQIEDDPTRG